MAHGIALANERSMQQHNKVLITGVTGLIGQIVLNELKGDYDLTGLARRSMEDIRHFRGDISDLQTILPAFEGQDAVVHLAADPDQNGPWDSILPNNLVGIYNALEACRIHGVRRMVFASSNHATGMYERDHPYHHIVEGQYDRVDVWPIPQVTHQSEVRPDGYYGASKAYGEALGRYYSEEHGISVICLRIGSVVAWDNPTRSIRNFATWQSHRDLAQQVRKSVESPDSVRFDIFYGVSDNKWRFWDIEHARDVIGYRPKDNAEDFRGRGRV